jgi:hypothetical protein
VIIQCKWSLVDLKKEDKVVWGASNSGKHICVVTWDELRVKEIEVS